ncbi:MAG: cell division protein CrgA [Acidobacteria bacterium]|nr:cell division protein CrgA [Acidobacteriota bacterium]
MAKSGSHKAAKNVGRYVDPHERGRITRKVEHAKDHSPHWFGWVLLDLMIFGVLVITLNYLQVLPGATSPWYLALGLVTLFAAFYLATRYR